MTTGHWAGRDIIVVGASAGGVEALSELVRSLPADLPATMFIVLHVPPIGVSVLPAILTRAGRLPAVHARDGMRFERGHVYIAPPDHHLLVGDGILRLSRGPREHGSRPAVDPLLRSAALQYGPRTIGVILSGTLDDGTAGLIALRHEGGLAIVQDPATAVFPGMPQSAVDNADPDLVLPLPAIGPKLVRLASTPFDTQKPERVSMPNAEQRAADVRRVMLPDAPPHPNDTGGDTQVGTGASEATRGHVARE